MPICSYCGLTAKEEIPNKLGRHLNYIVRLAKSLSTKKGVK